MSRLLPFRALVLIAAAPAIVLAGCGSGPTGSTGSTTPTSSAVVTSPPSSASPGPSESEGVEACASATKAAALYYLGDVVTVGPRLYREFAKVATCSDPISEALTSLFQVPPTDPDYTSLWPATTTVLSVTTSGPTATVDLSNFVAVGAAFESMSVQQLVWTATAADPTVRRVKILVNGQTPPSGHSDWSQPLPRANAFDTAALVWILRPGQGATVTSPVKVRVFGTGFEGNVPIKIFSSGELVASTYVTTEQGALAAGRTTIDLPAGTYVIKAYNDNGKDATLQLWDTKSFTVT